jgi:hypothetical protein
MEVLASVMVAIRIHPDLGLDAVISDTILSRKQYARGRLVVFSTRLDLQRLCIDQIWLVCSQFESTLECDFIEIDSLAS